MRRFLPLLLVCLCAPLAAQAFEVKVHADSDLHQEQQLEQRILRIANEVGHRIPADPQIKVVLTSRAKKRQLDNRFLHLQRISLTKVFHGGPPYPHHGWLPIRTIERYGNGTASEVDAALDAMLREFFELLKTIDPQAE